jgi:hypothetical protein
MSLLVLKLLLTLRMLKSNAYIQVSSGCDWTCRNISGCIIVVVRVIQLFEIGDGFG